MLIYLLTGCSDTETVAIKTEVEPKKEKKFIFNEDVKYFMELSNVDKLDVVFEYYNDTKMPQLIDTIKTTCTCTDVIYPHRIIEKGEKGNVSLSIDISNNNSFFSKSIVVYFRNQSPVVLKVVGRKK